jgi:hypothetical protein
MRDQLVAQQAAKARATRERVAALPYDTGTKRTGSVGAGIETGFIKGVAGALDNGTFGLYSPVIDRYRDEAVANSQRRARRAGVVPNQYVDRIVDYGISYPGGVYLASMTPVGAVAAAAKKWWER